VRVAVGRAGEVFGAPIRVAADRTKLEEGKLLDLPGADMEEAERRREACKVLPASKPTFFHVTTHLDGSSLQSPQLQYDV
jgi:hypothetical protein